LECRGGVSSESFTQELILSSSNFFFGAADEGSYEFDDAFGHQNGLGDVGVDLVHQVLDFIGDFDHVTQNEEYVDERDGDENAQKRDAHGKRQVEDVERLHGWRG